MPCHHKFIDYLNLYNLDFEPTTLIVGSFNPSWPAGNKAEWFYGRTARNYFWDVLPRLYGNDSLRKSDKIEWIKFCEENKIVITDLITTIEDAEIGNEEHEEILKSYLDTSIADYFNEFKFTNIESILDRYPSIKNIYLTRNEGVELFDSRWNNIKTFALNKGVYHLKYLLTPSASARFQIKEYKKNNPEDKTPLKNFIFEEWSKNWHF